MSTIAAVAPPLNQTQADTVAASLRQIKVELGSVYLERPEIIEIILIGVLSKAHTFLLGPPGTAKTSLVKAITQRFTGAKFFRALMDKGMPDTQLLGDYDIEAYEKGQGWGRDFRNTICDAHLAILDEAGKAGQATLNPLLTMLEEREHKPYKDWLKAPLLSAIGASNELLEDEGLAAIWDRFMLRYSVEYIKEPGNFAKLLRSRVRPTVGTSVSVPTYTTIDLNDLLYVIEEVIPLIPLTDAVTDTLVQLRSDLAAEGIIPSDRRWSNAIPILQASAFYNGRTAIDDDDLLILRHVLWDRPDQYLPVRTKVMALGSPVTRVAMELGEALDELEAEIAAQSGQARAAKAQYGGTANHKATVIEEKLNAAMQDAIDAKRNTTPLDQVSSQLKQIRYTILTSLLGMGEAVAKASAGIQ